MSEDKESLLARGYTLPAKKPKGPRPTVSGVRRKKRKPNRGFEKPKVRLRSKKARPSYTAPPTYYPPISSIVAMLETPSQDVIMQGIKNIADIAGDPGAREIVRNVTKKQYKLLMKNLRKLAERGPTEKISFLAYQALDRFRRARQDVGMLVIAKDPSPAQWIFRDGTVLPFTQAPPGRHMQRRRRGQRKTM